jgi:hypothetical protein
MTWFNLQTAEIAPGHAQDVLQATLGGFPAGSDAVLFHVMAWDATPAGGTGNSQAEPAHQHWALLDAHLRALPMSALRTLKHISLVYVTYRHPAQTPMVYTLQEERDGSAAQQEVADAAGSESSSGLAWGTHTFAVSPNAKRVTFTLGKPKKPKAASPFRTAGNQALPARSRMTFDFAGLGKAPASESAGETKLPSWMASAAKAANLGGDYYVSPTLGLLQAGDGSAYQPVYTGWITTGFGPPSARVYGGLVTETTMVFHDSLANLNWGTSYGVGAGVHFEWNNKD